MAGPAFSVLMAQLSRMTVDTILTYSRMGTSFSIISMKLRFVSTDTRGKAISGLMLENGNLVLYDADNKPCWRTDLENYQGARLVVQNDGSGVSIRKTIQLSQNEMVNSNESVVSKNGRYSLVLWSDGNLVLYHGGKAPVWKRQSESGKAISHLIMQEDGDLVLKDVDNIPSWQSHTDQHHGARFVVQDDGNM
ncbi:bulb-type lectin domain-containing protein, partial [Lipomyces doorenjongii]